MSIDQSNITHKGRVFSRHFTVVDEDPFEQIEWNCRDCTISNDRGEQIFNQKNVEAPIFWSDMSVNVVASKYLYGSGNKRESGVRVLISRIVNSISNWGKKDNYFSTPEDELIFKQELAYILLNQLAAFNSPVWFNVGLQDKPQCSACFIISVDDSMKSLLELQKTECNLFKWGSGCGTNLSTIRSCREKISGGGSPSGPVSFMRGFDSWAGIIKSGGKTRRAAKMQILNVDHPDILEFIACKSNEEKKAWALIEQGYDGSFAVPGGAYESVYFQNANLSVRAGDDFMQAAKNKTTYWTKSVLDSFPLEELDASQILKAIAEGTWICGDPGMQFDTTINDWHTSPNSGRVNASNPCSEYMHLDDSACNLASINLLKFLREDGSFDVDSYLHAVDVMITAQDILIDNASYPNKTIDRNAREYRQLGLGYANLGALIMNLGYPYDSDAGREWAALLAALMTGQAYKTSASLARDISSFVGYKKNREPMLEVIKKHRRAIMKLSIKSAPCALKKKAVQVWKDALEFGSDFGFRNSQATVLAPTGTISFMMGCDTTGIEPDIALVKYKKLSDGGFLKMVNRSVQRALERLGYSEKDISEIIKYIEVNDTIEGAPKLKAEHLSVFDCAFKPAKGERFIHYMGHVKMMSAAQPFISGAISKTVNLPETSTAAEIYDIYIQAWELGLKSIALYRDGSKRTQPLSTTNRAKKSGKVSGTTRRKLPTERNSITHKFDVAGLEGYLTVGLYDDKTPGEIFLVVAKEGSTLSGIMDAFAASISLSLQYGVPLFTLINKFTHTRFEPSGFTSNKEIPMAKSIIDYVFRWLALKFLSVNEISKLGLKLINENRNLVDDQDKDKNVTLNTFKNSEDAPPCTQCGSSMMVRQAGCYVCLNCGSQGGCG